MSRSRSWACPISLPESHVSFQRTLYSYALPVRLLPTIVFISRSSSSNAGAGDGWESGWGLALGGLATTD